VLTQLVLPGADGELKVIALDEEGATAYIYIDPHQIKLALHALDLNCDNHGGSEITIGSSGLAPESELFNH